jgi:hypothetical protein
MTTYQEKIAVTISDVEPILKTVSVCIATLLVNENTVIATLSKVRQAFAPGDIQKVKDFIGMEDSPEIRYLNDIWTQDVIDSYNTFVQETI